MAVRRWTAATNIPITGIAATLAAGANTLSDAIDNAVARDQNLRLELLWTNDALVLQYEVIEVYLLYAIDGVTYEDPIDAVSGDPGKTPDGVFVSTGGGNTDRQTLKIVTDPFHYKILLKSELSDGITAAELDAEAFNDEIL